MNIKDLNHKKVINVIDRAFCRAIKPQENYSKNDIDYHVYTDENNNVVSIKCRVYFINEQGKKDKFMRAFHISNSGNVVIGEPKNWNEIYPNGKGKKPIYLLPKIMQASDDEPIYIFEGEQKADLAVRLGFTATTTGSCTSVNQHDLQPLANRKVILWADYDDKGCKWLQALIERLQVLNCDIEAIDTDKLGLNDKDDIMDWSYNQQATGEYDESDLSQLIKNLPIVDNKEILGINADKHSMTDIIANNDSESYCFDYGNGYFDCSDKGVYFIEYSDDEEETPKRTKICSKLEVLAKTRDKQSNSWGLWLQWLDDDMKTHTWSMPKLLLQGDSSVYRQALVEQGLYISVSKKARNLLNVYLNNYPTDSRVLCVDKFGWHLDSKGNYLYVLDNSVFGQSEEKIVYQSDNKTNHGYSQQGTLDDWQTHLSIPLAEQSRFVMAISIAFTGQLLTLLNIEGGGFHVVGNSSTGKSTSLNVGASVWGHKDSYAKSWNTTKNATEGLALTHNDSVLILDELGEANPKELHNGVYMLINGKGKARLDKTATAKPLSNWKVMLLSSGEDDLETFISQSGEVVKEGVKVRLCSYQNDVGKGYYGFDSLVLAETGTEQARIINDRVNRFYGSAGIAWLEYLTANTDEVIAKAWQLIDDFMNEYKHLKLDSQANRIAKRFALVATAGELATQANITGWQTGQATTGVKSCFQSWIDTNGTEGNNEDKKVIEQVQSVLNGETWQFQNLNNKLTTEDIQPYAKRLGYRDDDNFYIFKSVFKSVCGKLGSNRVLSVLDNKKLLVKNHGKRRAYRMQVAKQLQYFYCIKREILEIE